MNTENSSKTDSSAAPVAYLIIRDGDAWRQTFHLVPGQVTTIGRAPTNRIVLLDEVCSRNHCEVFLSENDWYLRDLGSRNGTLVNEDRVTGDHRLQPGQLIRIGESELGFAFDLSQSFSRNSQSVTTESDTSTDYDLVEATSTLPILSRTDKPDSYLAEDQINSERTATALSRLYRLALDMGQASSDRALADLVLDTLFNFVEADIGAVLQVPASSQKAPSPADLSLVAFRSHDDRPYERVSDNLSSIVIRDRAAILARDIESDSELADSDSLESFEVRSVICAPLRVGDRLIGLVHIYTTQASKELTPDDLEFTLAVADQLAVSLNNLRQRQRLARGLDSVRNQNENLLQQLELQSQLVGDSPEMHTLRGSIARIAPTEATALIRGESGVGKELVARAIHFTSHRKDGPFICMNCAALSESLLESELFGHEKGAFTGATDRKTGKFEQANRGTLFLDEVGEMGPGLQAKFLRVLEGHAFERVGGDTPIQVNVRVVAATNRQLEQAVNEGSFRKDLYFRLQVVELHVPALRDHPSDIPQLAIHFMDRFRKQLNRQIDGFTDEAIEALLAYDWPGNIRELQNTIERTVILCTGKLVKPSDIQLSALNHTSPPAAASSAGVYVERSLAELEQEHILATLEATSWNKSRSAQILGIERSTLDRKLKRYRVSRPPEGGR